MYNNIDDGFSPFFIFNDPVDIVLSLDEQYEDEIYNCVKEMASNAPILTESSIIEEAESDSWVYEISLEDDYMYGDLMIDEEIDKYLGSIDNSMHMDYGQMIDIISAFEDNN